MLEVLIPPLSTKQLIMYVIFVVANSDSADDSNFLWFGELCRIVMTLIIIFLRLVFGLIMS
jgi:hypothetical protein